MSPVLPVPVALDVALKATLVLLCAFMVAALCARGSAAMRHRVLSLAVAAVLAIPLLAWLLPAWRVELPIVTQATSRFEALLRENQLAGSAASIARLATLRVVTPATRAIVVVPRSSRAARAGAVIVAGGSHDEPVVIVKPARAASMPRPAAVAVAGGDAWDGDIAMTVPVMPRAATYDVPVMPSHAAIYDMPGGGEAGGAVGSERFGPVAWLGFVAGMLATPFLLVVWLAGALAVLSLLVVSRIRVARIARRARPLGGWPALAARRVARELGLVTEVQLLEGDADAMPMTWGVLRARLLLPAGAERWPIARLEAVLRHELAHVRRRDALTQLLGDLACAVYWFNPLAWIAAHRLRVERELACDDEVLAGGARATEYADHLLDIARTLRNARATSLTALAMARPAQLRWRILAVLDDARDHGRLSARAARGAWLLALGLVVPFAAFTPWQEPNRPPAPPRAPMIALMPLMALAPPAPPAPPAMPSPPAMPAPHAMPVPRAMLAPRASPAPPGTPVPDPAPLSVRSRLALFGIPAMGARCWETDGDDGSLSVHRNDDVQVIEWSRGDCRASVRIEGEIGFSEDFTAIDRLSRGGFVRIREDDGDTEREVEIRPGDGSQLEYRWKVDGDERPFDAQGRAWLSEMLLHVFRTTGLAAKERVAWMLGSGGPDAVLQEIAHLGSDYTRRIYYQALLADRRLDDDAAGRVLRQAGEEIGSDYELAELLIGTAKVRGFTPAVRDAYIGASASLGSDYEHRRVLAGALADGRLSAENVRAILGAALSIGSDYERAELLTALTDFDLSDEANQEAYLKAADGIGSDYEHHRVLSALLNRENGPLLRIDGRRSYVSPAALTIVLRSALGIDSDYEKAELLTGIAGKYQLTDTQREAFMRALDTIDSEYEHGRVASALLRKQSSR